MSVVDQLKNFFVKKVPESDQDSRLSLGVPGASIYPMEMDQITGTTESGQPRPVAPGRSSGDTGEGIDEEATNLIALPVLGKKTVVQHQRLLSILLGLALVLLAVVTLFALNQANKVAQQLGATGQSLMQSQRLAKSVSQALVGGAEAFPDVVESSGVLAKSVRGLKTGDEQMGLSALSPDYLPELDKITPLMERAEKNAAIVLGQQKY